MKGSPFCYLHVTQIKDYKLPWYLTLPSPNAKTKKKIQRVGQGICFFDNKEERRLSFLIQNNGNWDMESTEQNILD